MPEGTWDYTAEMDIKTIGFEGGKWVETSSRSCPVAFQHERY